MADKILIMVSVVPHASQPYETAGEWYFGADGVLHVEVSDVGDDDCAALVAVHEIVEALACRKHGVSYESVCDFDRAHLNDDEPGANPKAPYFKEHAIADVVERLVATQLGVVWRDYDTKIDSLFKKEA